jgi:hypothetical protein
LPATLVELASVLKLEIAYDGGIKIKNGMWTPPMSPLESFDFLRKFANDNHIKVPAYLGTKRHGAKRCEYCGETGGQRQNHPRGAVRKQRYASGPDTQVIFVGWYHNSCFRSLLP